MTTPKFGGAAALAQAILSIANIVVALGILPALGFTGQADLADPAQALALRTPLLWLEVFKLVSAIVLGLTFFYLVRRLWNRAKAYLAAAALSGALGVGLLFAAGVLGVTTLSQTVPPEASLPLLINQLGLASIALTGLCVLLISGVALHTGALARPLNQLGIALGVVSVPVFLLPPLALLVLFLGLAWFTWLGVSLLRSA